MSLTRTESRHCPSSRVRVSVADRDDADTGDRAYSDAEKCAKDRNIIPFCHPAHTHCQTTKLSTPDLASLLSSVREIS